MPTSTYTALATVTLSSTDTSVTFSSIPSTYRDIVIAINGKLNSNGFVYLTHNGVGTGYSYVYAYGNGSTYSSGAGSDDLVGDLGTDSSTLIAQVMDYSATDKQKTTLVRTSANHVVVMTASRWANTNAINQIEVSTNQTFQIGTTISLFGIEA